MPWRRLTDGLPSVVCVLLVSIAAVAPSSAADGPSRVVVNTARYGTFSSAAGVPPGPWTALDSGCISGVEKPPYAELRCAIEFPLSLLPAGATIAKAVLGLGIANPPGDLQTALYGYQGDGVITPADVADDLPGPPLLFTPPALVLSPSPVPSWIPGSVSIDVTKLLGPTVDAAGWAGFSLRQEPRDPDPGPALAVVWTNAALTIDFMTPGSPPPSLSPSAFPSPRTSVAVVTVPPTDLVPRSTQAGSGSLTGVLGALALIASLALAIAHSKRRRIP